MEEDLEGYMDWLTQADDLETYHGRDANNSLKVDVGKHKGDPVVMGLLKSTMFPLQQVLEGIRSTRIYRQPPDICSTLHRPRLNGIFRVQLVDPVRLIASHDVDSLYSSSFCKRLKRWLCLQSHQIGLKNL